MSYSCICCKHFTDEDISSHPTKWVLKNGAVPSQFDWSNKQNRKRQLLRVVPNAAVAVQPTIKQNPKYDKIESRELFKPSTDSASLEFEIEKNNFRFRWVFSEGDVTKRTCFGKVGHLWPALVPNQLTHSFGQSFVENQVKIRVYRALD